MWLEAVARGAKRTVPSILVTLVGTVGIFSAPSNSFLRVGITKAKKSTLGGKSTTFCRNHGYSTGIPTYCDENCCWKIYVYHKTKAQFNYKDDVFWLAVSRTAYTGEVDSYIASSMAIQDSLEIWILRFGLRFRFPILGKKEAVEFRTIITLIPKKEISVHAYIITLRVLFQCSFPTQLKNDIQDRFTANRQIDNAKECSFFISFFSVPVVPVA